MEKKSRDTPGDQTSRMPLELLYKCNKGRDLVHGHNNGYIAPLDVI